MLQNNQTVPFSDPKRAYSKVKDELDKAYKNVMSSGAYIAGSEVDSFEKEFAQYCGVKHCVGVGNGLDALTLILKAMGIGEGDEVIVPGHTFIATWLAVSSTGAKPVPVAPDGTFNINPDRIAETITQKTKAIIVVHMYGHPVDIDSVDAIANDKGIPIIEDAAQAHGATYKGKKTGGLSYASAFSFYPTKNLGAFGDGGAITTNDAELANKISILKNYGAETKNKYKIIGYNSRLDEIQAAFLRVKLKHLEDWNSRRSAIAQRYLEEISNSETVLPELSPDIEHSWHLFVIKSDQRDHLQKYLREQSVQTLVHYPTPIDQQEVYLTNAGCDICEDLSSKILSLPMDPFLTEEETSHVIKAVSSFGV